MIILSNTFNLAVYFNKKREDLVLVYLKYDLSEVKKTLKQHLIVRLMPCSKLLVIDNLPKKNVTTSWFRSYYRGIDLPEEFFKISI